MNLRQTLSEKPTYALVTAGALLVTAVVCIGLQSRTPGTPSSGTRVFFSTDEGKTWFPDDAKKRAPFVKDGKEAVRAYVYQGTDGKPFVNHLERFTPEAKQTLQESDKADPDKKVAPNLSGLQGAYASGREVKRPGETKWVSTGNVREAGKVFAIKSPNGVAEAVPVVP